MGGIKVFLVVTACWHGHMDQCQWLKAHQAPSRVVCSLKRPFVSSLYQQDMKPGWFVFTKCMTQTPPSFELKPNG